MTCGHCKVAVTQEVSKVAGVSGVEVDLDAKRVPVHGTGVDDAAVIAAIDEAGYDAETTAEGHGQSHIEPQRVRA